MIHSIYCPDCSKRAAFDIIVDGPQSDCPVCRACGRLIVVEEPAVLRTPPLDYRWTPPPVFEAMRRSLFARPFCDECRRRSPVDFTHSVDYHPRAGDACEGCGAVYATRQQPGLFPLHYWRRRGALEVMREALGLLPRVSASEPASGVSVQSPRPAAR